MILDAHTHIVPPEVVRDRRTYLELDLWFRRLYANERRRLATADHLLQSMTRASVDASVTFGFAWRDTSLCVANNDYILERAARHPDRLIPFCVVAPANTEFSIVEMERCRRRGAVGVGELFPEGQDWNLHDRGAVREFIGAVRALGLILNLHVSEPVGHAYPGKDSTTPERIWPLIEAAGGQVPIVLSHWGGGAGFYELMPEAQALAHRLYYDSAASHLLYRHEVFAVMAHLAPGRTLFGSDYPLVSQPRALQRLRAAGLSPEAEAVLLHGAADALGLTAGLGDPAAA
ncbi:MAG: amidohydrolase family protein [Actinobacteria bacterium]|nr:amidohydrolase family protein [Actinomycetota bacterium]